MLLTSLSSNKFMKLHQSDAGDQSATAGSEGLFYQHLGAAPEEKPAYLAAPFGDGEKFTLEFDVVTDRTEAINRVEALAAQGIQAFFTPYERKGQVYYRVRLGIFSNQSDALQHSRELAVVKGMKTKLIQLQ
jgi:cell division septation protein DedD